MAGSDQRWITIAADFPAGLDSDTDPTKLQDGMTPDAYNMNIDKPGKLASLSAAQGIGTANTARTYAIAGNVYTWHYQRCWLMSGAALHYLAPEIQDAELYQDIGKLGFDETAGDLVTFFPFSNDAMFAGKAVGAYIVPNAASPNGRFQHLDLQEALKVAESTHACPFGENAYVSNTSGLYVWDGQNIVELTKHLQCVLTTYFGAKTLRPDEARRRIVGSNVASAFFIYVPDSKRTFAYTATYSDFRFTTRTLIDKRWRPFTIFRTAFEFINTTQDASTLTYQIKTDRDWSDDITVEIKADELGRVRKESMLPRPLQARKFAMRITGLPSNIEVSQIDVLGENISVEESYSE